MFFFGRAHNLRNRKGTAACTNLRVVRHFDGVGKEYFVKLGKEEKEGEVMGRSMGRSL